MRIIDADVIAAMARVPRANFVNGLSGFKSACLVGTAGTDGLPNLSLFSSAVHVGANPPLLGIISRPPSVPRHTLSNLRAAGVFTLNHIHAGIWEAAHQTSAKYDAQTSEFAAVGLTPYYAPGFAAPFVAEARLRIGLAYEWECRLPNDCVLVIGQIQFVEVPDGAVGEDGYVDIESLETVAISGLDGYHSTRRLGRLAFAEPGKTPERIA